MLHSRESRHKARLPRFSHSLKKKKQSTSSTVTFANVIPRVFARGPKENNANVDATATHRRKLPRLRFERVTGLSALHSYIHRAYTDRARKGEIGADRGVAAGGGGVVCYLWTRIRDPTMLWAPLSRIVMDRGEGFASSPGLLTLSVTHFHLIICPLHLCIDARIAFAPSGFHDRDLSCSSDANWGVEPLDFSLSNSKDCR